MDDLPRPAPASNVPEYTVSEISGAVKRTLEGAFGRIRVRGEITELKRYPSGHIYLSLKDEGAKIAAVVWKSAAVRLRMEPENGVEVIVDRPDLRLRERSAYQLIVDRMDTRAPARCWRGSKCCVSASPRRVVRGRAQVPAAGASARRGRNHVRTRRRDPGYPHDHRATLPAHDPALAGAGAGRGGAGADRRGHSRLR